MMTTSPVQTERVRTKDTVRVVLWKIVGKNNKTVYRAHTSVVKHWFFELAMRATGQPYTNTKGPVDIFLSAEQTLWMLLRASGRNCSCL